jgi:hypothetical protein
MTCISSQSIQKRNSEEMIRFMIVAEVAVLLALLLLENSVATEAGRDDDAAMLTRLADDGFDDLVAWVKSHGGRVDARISMGSTANYGNDGDNGIRGVMALEDIIHEETDEGDGVELLHCPWELVIGSSGMDHQMTSEEDMCQVVRLLASEYEKGEESMGWPYLKHIDDLPRLPAMWSPAAVDELQGLIPPSDTIDRHLQWFSINCGGGDWWMDDASTVKALVAFITRANAVGMTPIYDLLNHHNGLKNAKLFLTPEGVALRTVRPVYKGEQLYLSYGLKPAAQLFRDYGFVEAWPTLWSWKDAATSDNHVVALFPDGIAAIHPSPDFLKGIWKSTRIRTVVDYQESATQYTDSLKVDQLQRFTVAAHNLLSSLPTTLQADEDILKLKQQERQHNQQHDSTNIHDLDDIIAAIHYRLTFKRAVSDALVFAIVSINTRGLAAEEL